MNDSDPWLSPDDVCAQVPKMTKQKLANRRFSGLEPTYYSPTPRTILYRQSDITAWLEGSARTATRASA